MVAVEKGEAATGVALVAGMAEEAREVAGNSLPQAQAAAVEAAWVEAASEAEGRAAEERVAEGKVVEGAPGGEGGLAVGSARRTSRRLAPPVSHS
jgi:uncharacterized protein YgbK (DUF1537 family)